MNLIYLKFKYYSVLIKGICRLTENAERSLYTLYISSADLCKMFQGNLFREGWENSGGAHNCPKHSAIIAT